MRPDDEIFREFLVEIKENLDSLDQRLLELERSPGDRSVVDVIFRALHSIKGAAGFFGFRSLEGVAHTGENLLNGVREGTVAVNADIITVLLKAHDALRTVVATIEETGAEGQHDVASLLAHMERLTPGAEAHAPPPAAPHTPASAAADPPTAPPAAPASTATPAPAHTVPSAPAHPAEAEAAPARADVEGSHGGETVETIRVDVKLLDELMDLVGELVLSRNQVLQITQSAGSGELAQSSQQLDRITTELQERVMKTRMQPIKHVWGKFPRIIRDLSHQLAKRVRIEMEGEETELDRTLIEAIRDPLTHIVRNAVDHGIEMPAVREAAGKNPEGLFVLRAFHESGQVIIEVEDDGAGIHVDRLKRKAVEKGLITEDEAVSMPYKEALHLIFKPGLSTAEKVTTISGRGVGMDVVRSNIERIGGTIEVESKVGEGTSFRIKIPLTLAIIPALIINTEGARFAVPQVNVVELIRFKGEDVHKAIERVHGTIAMRLRGNILPLLDLRDLLAGAATSASQASTIATVASRDQALNIVVMQANRRKFGLLVKGIEESQEIVVKPLMRQLQDIPTYAGATILGDGSIALILDTVGIATYGHLMDDKSEHLEAALDASHVSDAEKDIQNLLLVEYGGGGRMAIPLENVARLEKFPHAKIDNAGGQRVVQYGEEILRLGTLSELLPSGYPFAPSTDGVANVVVFSYHGRNIGLVVDRILDIVALSSASFKSAYRSGALATAVIRDRVTEVLDLEAVLRTAMPDWFERVEVPANA